MKPKFASMGAPGQSAPAGRKQRKSWLPHTEPRLLTSQGSLLVTQTLPSAAKETLLGPFIEYPSSMNPKARSQALLPSASAFAPAERSKLNQTQLAASGTQVPNRSSPLLTHWWQWS